MQEIFIASLFGSVGTAFFGFIAFIYSQVYFKYSQSYKVLKAKTVNQLTYFANIYSNPLDIAETVDHKLPESYEIASMKLRELAGEWRALIEMKPNMPFLPSQNICFDVSKNLIGLSNGMVHPYNQPDPQLYFSNRNLVDEISKKLKFYKAG